MNHLINSSGVSGFRTRVRIFGRSISSTTSVVCRVCGSIGGVKLSRGGIAGSILTGLGLTGGCSFGGNMGNFVRVSG